MGAQVNGSLWTLPAEFLMYLLLPLYGSRHIALCRTVIFPSVLIAAVALGFYFTWVMPLYMRPIIYWSSLPQIVRWAPYFLGGAAFAFWRIERYLRLDVSLIVIGLISCFRPLGMPVEGMAAMMLTPYIVLSFCMTREGVPPLLDWDADFSYGTYLYAFPIQQTVIFMTGNKITPLVLFAICLPVVYCMGLLSWFLIERPALSRKPWRRVSEGLPTDSRP
jgi:peptidoglycan/LPS O-acetylase OafA/YrhL